jgi:ribosomal protein S18 acetylase RimI-like enzyme
MSVVIRLFQAADRRAVRKICADSADMGKPAERIFPDRELLADMMISYYTDFEPQSLWIAEVEGEVVGYLSGCLDSRRFLRVMIWRIAPGILFQALIRGIFLKKQVQRFLIAMLKSFKLGGFKRSIPFDKYPAHLHIDIREGFRGQGIGQGLMEKFFAQAKNAGIPGIYLTTRQDNTACRFFERTGFSIAARYPLVIPEGDNFQVIHSVLYVKEL